MKPYCRQAMLCVNMLKKMGLISRQNFRFALQEGDWIVGAVINQGNLDEMILDAVDDPIFLSPKKARYRRMGSSVGLKINGQDVVRN